MVIKRLNPFYDKDSVSDEVLTFNITDIMKQAGISQFFLKNNDFVIKFEDEGMRCCPFDSRNPSISEIMKKMHQKLKHEPNYKSLKDVLVDIENQLIERSEEIFAYNRTPRFAETTNEFDEIRSKFKDRVTKLREQHVDAGFSYEEWKSSIAEKYDNLRHVVQRNFPGAWPLLEFCLAVKTILNIEGCTLPFIGVLLDVPSSLKTLVIELFRKYPHSFYSDSFTPNSLISHNSALTEEQLQKVDMIPKMRNKLVLIPEMASIFTSKDDDLRRVLGHITRLADGHGLESDSGAQGHRKYGNTFFGWIGAAVEIPPRVWKLLGTLGHKIHFFRPFQTETKDEELLEIVKSDNFSKKLQEVENVLYDYLITLEAAPDGENTRISSDGITKIKWNNNTNDEQEDALVWMTKLSRLLAHLRGSVYLSETKPYRVKNKDNEQKDTGNSSETKASAISYVEELDYDNGIPIIEKPTRAVTLLRNLAIGHAFSQGRDSISSKDLPMIIRVVLSTTMIGRSKVFELLIEMNGELSTSTICRELGVSPPTAKRAMRELQALKLVVISSGYNSAELKITLTEKFAWIKTSEFKELWEKSAYNSENNGDGETDQKNSQVSNTPVAESPANDAAKNNEGFGNGTTEDTELCDHKSSHTPKVNSPPETQIKNIGDNVDSDYIESSEHNFDTDQNSTENYKDIQIPESRSDNHKGSEVTSLSNNTCDGEFKSEGKK